MSSINPTSKTNKSKTKRLKLKAKPIKNRDDIPDCINEDDYKERVNKTRKIHMNYRKLCSEHLYEDISRHFDSDKSIKNLLKFTYRYYKEQKNNEKDGRYMLYLRDYINLFPRDDNIKGFRKQHVFECICKVLLLFNYDNNEFEGTKKFYKALEKYKKNPNSPTPLKDGDIINEDINDGSGGQSVDIMFKLTPHNIDKKSKKGKNDETEKDIKNTQPSCLNYKSKSDDEKKYSLVGEKFILIQNKYFTEEKSSADKYDVTKISTRAKNKIGELDGKPYEIVLMINDKQKLEERIRRNRNDDFKLVDRIFGASEIDDWFQAMLYDMLNTKNFNEWLNSKIGKNITGKQSLSLRFHQKIIVESSNEYINKDYRKLIWGAVPRSGKSYMIAGLIEKRKHLRNDIVIILGAKTETLEQFKKMFQSMSDFDEYGIIAPNTDTASAKLNKLIKEKKEKYKNYIYIYSQELIKISFNKKTVQVTENQLEKFKEKFIISNGMSNKKIDFYFDEIHKGGSTPKAEKDIITAIDRYVGKIDIFVMVTATYAKPTIAYTNIIQDKSPITINWSYKDQQQMKEITNPDNLQNILDTRETNILAVNDKEIVENILLEYEKRYGDYYLNELEDEYKKHPELVLINPMIGDKPISIHPNTFMFDKSCNAISDNLETLRNPDMIFENNVMVKELIRSIGGYGEDNQLDENTIYGKLQYNYKYDWGKPHTELWFFPGFGLYGENADHCRDTMSKKGLKTTGEDQQEYANEYEEKEAKENLPNIEPVTRGMVLNLLADDFFKANYCFVIVHGQKINYYSVNNTTEVFKNNKRGCADIKECECVHLSVEGNNNKEIKQFIHDKEIEAFSANKKLIILTGSKLRLGVSLPCVDIAFNFDNTQSVDLNYQTMFRVLTEREGKEYGYYVDFNKERSINFMYQFNEIYSSGLKKSKNIDQLTENLQALLYLFNYNGLKLIKSSPMESINLYQNLIKELNLDSKSYEKRYLNKNTEFLKKIIVLGGDNYNDVLKSFKSYAIKGDKDKKDIKKELEKKEKQKQTYYEGDRKGEEEEKAAELSEPEDEDDEDDVDNIKDIVELFITFTAIIALFSNEIECDELVNDKSSGCVDKLIHSLDDAEKRDELYCNCEKYLTTLGCYIQRTEGWTATKYKNALQKFKKFLEDNNPNHEQLINSIKIIYASIKDNMGKNKNALIYDMDTINIQDKIEQYLPVRKIEKDLYGEVFTPQSLIEEMLGKLPKSVWSNPDLKWLDPANGIGNFPMIAFKMLDEGLSKVAGYENKTKRQNHIIKNMLYMVELNEKNVAISRKIFGKDANIFCGSFLNKSDDDVNKDIIKKFGVEKFDIIMGNPPYSNRFNTGDNKPYICFTFVSIGLLKDNDSNLVFITPESIYDYITINKRIKQKCKIYQLDNMLNITYLNINTKYLQGLFNGVGSTFLYFVINNKTYKNNTFVFIDNDKPIKMNLKNYESLNKIRLEVNEDLLKINKKIYGNKKTFTFEKATFDGKQRRIRKEHHDKGIVRKKESDIYKYKIISNILENKDDDNKDDDFEVYYYNNKDKDYDKKRIIVMEGPSYLKPRILKASKYTLADNIYYSVCDNENNLCENMLYFLNSKLGKYIDKQTRPTNNNTPLIDKISYLKLPVSKISNDTELYKYYKLTNDEILSFDKDYKLLNINNTSISKIKSNSKQRAKTYSKPKSKSKSPDNKTKKFKTAGKVINRKTIKKPKIKKKKRTIKRKFWF